MNLTKYLSLAKGFFKAEKLIWVFRFWGPNCADNMYLNLNPFGTCGQTQEISTSLYSAELGY